MMMSCLGLDVAIRRVEGKNVECNKASQMMINNIPNRK